MRVARKLSVLFCAAPAIAGATLAGPAAAAELLSVKNESANFREGPGEKHPIVFSADRFYPVEVVEKKDAWVKVKDFEGDVAWVAERLLVKQETVVVEGDRVNVRDKAGTTSEIVFKAERGEVFKVEERQGKWLRVVDANGDGGWVRDDMVWGERMPAAAAPKGKTKGELEDPAKATPVVVKEPPAAGDADEKKVAPKAGAEAKPKEPKEPKEPREAKGKAADAKAAKADDAEDAEAKDEPSDEKAEKKAAPKASEKASEKAADKPATKEAPAAEPEEKAPAEKPAAKEAPAEVDEG